MNKIIDTNLTQDILIEGADKIFQLIKLTYGPRGKNILLDKETSELPTLSKQTAYISNNISFKDQIKNIPILLIQQSLNKISKLGGEDSTTPSFLITYYLLLNGLKNIYKKVYSLEIKNGIKKAINYLISLLTEIAQPIKNDQALENLVDASFSTENNLNKMISSAFKEMGKNGVLTIEDNTSSTISLDIQKGMRFKKGYFSPYFVTDPNQMVIELSNPYLLITNEKITFQNFNIIDILEELIHLKRSLIIISPDIDEEVLSTLILNKINGVLDLAYIRIAQSNNYNNVFLEDIALYTEGYFFKKENTNDLKKIKLSYLGQAKKVIISKTTTTILKDDSQEIVSLQKRCDELRQQILLTDSDYEREKLEDRIKTLYGVNVLLKVGAQTDFELQELKLRIENAIKITKSSLFEGIVPGGGISFILLLDDLESWLKLNLKDLELVGGNLVLKAIMEPFKTLLNNNKRGQRLLPKDSNLIEKFRDLKSYDLCYDFSKEKILNMYESKNFDSLKSIIVGLQTSLSLIQMMLTIEKIIG